MRGKAAVKGFSMVEVSVSVAIIAVMVGVGTSFSSQMFKSMARNRSLTNLAREHNAAKALVFSLPLPDGQRTACQGHPYGRVVGGVCVPDVAGPASAAQLAALTQLRNVFFLWPEMSSLEGGRVAPRLDQAYFESAIRPAIIAAGCTTCHNGANVPGATADINRRNFSIYGDLAQPTGIALNTIPVVGRAIVNSKMGKRLLATSFVTSGFLAGSRGVRHSISLQPNAMAVKEMVRNGPLIEQGYDPSIGICPGPCPPGQISEPTTCRVRSGIVCDACGKKKCMGCQMAYERIWSCLIHQDFSRSGINAIVTTMITEPLTGTARYLTTEGTLQ